MGGGTVPTPSASTYPKLVHRPVGKQIENIYRERLNQFSDDGQYSGQNLKSKWYHSIYEEGDNIKLSVYSPPDLTRPSFKEATSHTFKPTKRGESFGPSWSTHWFKIQLKVPEDMRKGEHLEFEWDSLNEGLVWSEDGLPLQGLTGGNERIEWIIPKSWRDGDEHIFYVEMACNRMFGNYPGGDTIQPPIDNIYYPVNRARLVDVNVAARQLHVDFWIIGDAAREFPGDSWERHKALQVCNKIMDVFYRENGSQESILQGRKIAQEYIGKHVDTDKVYESELDAIVNAIGNCHIDTCWLWPWAETKRKVARSWSSQCDLIDRYPEYRFVASQAQQFKWLKEFYPHAFDRVKQKVKEGRFMPIGGSWVEHDTNMPSGESLVRQFLYGQRFFESHFGERSQTFWLPDTFGYSPQIPQICRISGMTRFFTQKLSWNNINNFPHTTFNWVSLDGSQVLCHMAPSETYTAEAHFGELRRSVTQHKSLDQDNTSLMMFGKGDGGGGPTATMIEKLRRCRGISDNTSTLLPRVSSGTAVDEFFARLEAKAKKGTEFTTWYGELYLELHRGTYTTQANNKRNNRAQEVMMHDVEYLATLASLKDKSYKYPKREIDEIWENILLCQFHDCLPGSSIEMCYDDTDKLYAHNAKLGTQLKEKALSVLGFTSSLKPAAQTWFAVNTLPWQRSELVHIKPVGQRADQSHYALVSGGQGMVSAQPASALEQYAAIEETRKGVFVLSNKHFQVEVEAGAITSLIDLEADREVVAKGQKANQLVIFDDKPLYWQAWDVEVYHFQSRKELASEPSEIKEKGPYRVSVVTKTKISDKSWAKTTISLDASVGDSEHNCVVVETEVEWHETMKFLKVEFPVDVVNTEASYETQYGIIKRATHYNTSWEMAKFEVCCHKFADLSEANYGVSILNDSKYGFATTGNMMRLSLLRAPKAPDAHADMKHHRIKWAIMPHTGALGPATVKAARNFNHPMSLVSSTVAKPAKDLFKAVEIVKNASGSLVLDVVKRGEDDADVSRGEFPDRTGGRSVVVRIYESMGGKSRGILRTNLPVRKVYKTNALEDNEEQYNISDGDIAIELRAFEVATFKLQL